ncbi:MAG TPA: hypothetical protein VE978_14755 [Chitinophagales bacterium]|nr:hypothetical protein [Chitinophagales bacterium]
MKTKDTLNLNEKFSSLLKEGETILWTGKPVGGIQIRDADIILIPISIILLGFSVILDYVLLHFESEFIFKVIGVMFALAAIYLGGIRFLLDVLKRKRTFYCITTKRVIVISGRKRKLQTLPLKNIERLDKTLEKDGSGFIIFGNTNPLWPWLLGSFYMSGDNVPGLNMVPDVKAVFAILEAQIKVEMPASLKEEILNERREELN